MKKTISLANLTRYPTINQPNADITRQLVINNKLFIAINRNSRKPV